MRTNYPSINSSDIRQWEFENFRDGDRQYIRRSSYANFACWRITCIYEQWLGLKFEITEIFAFFLVESAADRHGEICAHHSVVAEIDDRNNIFHRLGGASRFSNVSLHGLRLFSGRFHRLRQLESLKSKNEELQNANSSKSVSCYYKLTRKINQVSIIRRFACAVLFLLCGLVSSFHGWKLLDEHRILLGTSLLLSTAVLGILGFGVLLSR